ncbi:MAG: CPXCG motif-containing cysteine-rich protein [Elusimicrobia bacterium]|nr:CPXCG motif-containing cysteine-rich protein [Elusimicrobiota bacterium]
MAKMKAPARAKKAKKISAPPAADAHEHRTAEKVMETVLKEHTIEASTERLDQWVTIECPHCGEATELHVIADMDGQSIDQDCTVCCRAFVAHIEIDEGEAHVGVEAS